MFIASCWSSCRRPICSGEDQRSQADHADPGKGERRPFQDQGDTSRRLVRAPGDGGGGLGGCIRR
jgi:hypothetical protein